ncbi:hypothetical protein CPB84DRAFT_1359046 [Gymnopilus junonius]|uniref:Uncharacterized protein n=1 Tax=Gymnopilus junonius TaxID=109634 RepID=A0A9P5TS83_GYMJU|nr:hypothetical protein CPB84DRAFT_1359046 [Gymnopilus junonius]
MEQPPFKKARVESPGEQCQGTQSFNDSPHVGKALDGSSNSDKGLLHLPVELQFEILDWLQKITLLTRAPNIPELPVEYLKRTDTLRALSQVCAVYRRAYLGFLWETVNVCVPPVRKTEILRSTSMLQTFLSGYVMA